MAQAAGLGEAFAAVRGVAVVEEYPGVGSTDFWGISFAFSSFDQQPLSEAELARELGLLRAAWAFFDAVRGRVSAELQKGPRGGGKDRDRIVRHVLVSELDMTKKVGVRTAAEDLLTADGLAAHRAATLDAIRTFHAEGKPARGWPLRYLIRHMAYHSLDHAWEMEDKDLTGK